MMVRMTKLLSVEMLEAAASGDAEAVTKALERGADLWAENLSGQTALGLALAQQEEDLALMLLGRMCQSNPDLGWLTEKARTTGNTYLHQAIVGRCFRTMGMLLKVAGPLRSRALRQENAQGLTPLLLAIQSHQADRYATALLKVDGGLLEDVQLGFSPLSLAVSENKESLVTSLLDLGASVELPEAKPAWSCIQSMPMVERLSKHVEYATVKTSEGENILHVLGKRGADIKVPLLKAVLRLVLPNNPGALLERCSRGRTVLHVATAHRCSEAVLDVLLKEGARWTILDEEGRTPLSWAQAPMANGQAFYPESSLDRWSTQERSQALDDGLPLADVTSSRPRF
jgi:hypothetical protein